MLRTVLVWLAGRSGRGQRVDPRPSWYMVLLDAADAFSQRADCTRRQVCAIIFTSDYRVVSIGYNGAPPGMPGCLTDGACPRGRLSQEELPSYSEGPTSYTEGPGRCIANHAERNAIARSDWRDLHGSAIIVTVEPCPDCYKEIAGTPIKEIVFRGVDGKPVVIQNPHLV